MVLRMDLSEFVLLKDWFLVLTNSQKELLYRLAKSTTGHLVMKERQDLSLLFDVLWDSVKHVSAAFLKYDQ